MRLALGLLLLASVPAAANPEAELALYEKQYSTTRGDDAVLLLPRMADAAYKSGDLRRAKRYARRALTRAGEVPSAKGRIVFESRVMLGRLALGKGDLTEAVKQLDALTGKHAPQAESLPADELARDLHRAGKPEAAKRYYERLTKLDPSREAQAKEAVAALEAGKEPAWWSPAPAPAP